ncbi:hypothetical protein RHS03_08593, partial [Rhizoctonia solani]
MSLGMWLVVSLRYQATISERWMANTKDAIMGSVSPVTGPFTLALLGHPRKISIPYPLNPILVSPIKKALGVLFFRRVRPVETRLYAFARNSFAAVSIAALIFRTATAFQQAQNEVGTRVTSSDCGLASPYHNISVLLDRLIHDDRWGNASSSASVTISTVVLDPASEYQSKCKWYGSECRVLWSQIFNVSVSSYPTQNQTRVLEYHSCSMLQKVLHYTQESSDIEAYQVRVQPIANMPRSMLLSSQMPRLWLLNSLELPIFFKGSLSDISKLKEVREYLPPMKLLRGSSIVGKANLITRRFIISSIVKDIIFNSKPVSDRILFALVKGNIRLTYFKDYRHRSLYPIVESSVAPLNISGDAIALATIRLTLSPSLMYYRNEAAIQEGGVPVDNVCDFIEDYRSSTILDVIGSVGGLFALLQAAHLLLFGRPLFWGLVGAKTISPFGLLGQCSSRGFKRRLREEYHIQSTKEGTDTIHIVKFLRDFVIDFGPANLDSESHALQQSRPSSPRVETHEESAAEAQTPLMRTPPEDESSLGETKPVDDQSYPNKAVRRNSI